MSKGSDQCKIALAKQFGPQEKDGVLQDGVLTNDDINRLVDGLERFKDNHINNGGTIDSFKKIAVKLIEEDRRNLLNKQIEAHTNLTKKKARAGDAALHIEGLEGKKKGRAAADALLAKASGSNRLKKGANASAYRYQKARMIEYKSNLYHSMKQRGVFDAFQNADDAMQLDIMKEMWHMGDGLSGPATANPIALEIAGVLRGHNQRMLSDMRLAGMQIGEIKTYVMPQTHNRDVIRELGKEAWINKIGPELDQVKTFGIDAGDAVKMKEFLDHAYDSIVDGRSKDVDDILQASDELITTTKYQNLGNKLSQSRAMHFKDADSFMRYNSEFGRHDLFGGVMQNTEATAKAMGLIEVYGTNPDAAIQADISSMKRALKGDKEALSAFEGGVKAIENTFASVRGTSAIPANDMMAKGWGAVRAMASLTKLGMAGIRGFTDLANAAAVISATTGKPYLTTQLDVIGEFLGQLRPGRRSEMSALLGAHFKDYLLNIHGRNGMDADMAPGMISKGTSLLFRMNGQEMLTETARGATAKTMSNYAAGFADKGFKDMGDDLLQLRSNLERYNIDDKMWEHIRKGVVDLPDGTKGIVPEAIGDRKAQQVWGNFLNDIAELGSPEPTARAKQRLIHGTQPGTPMGEFLRTITQFKAFPVFMYDVASRVHMSNPNRPINEMREIFKGRGDFKNTAGFMLGTTVLAYTADSLIEMSQNRQPKNPADPKVIGEMFARGGAGGLYSDMLISESMKSKPDWIKSLAGPTAGTVADMADIGLGFLKGRDVGLKAFNAGVSAVPYNNVFMLKSVLDYTLLDGMRQSIDPSFEAKKARRLREQDRGELF